MKIANIAELKTRKGTSDFNVSVLGYYSKGDGGGGEFFWDNTSILSDNGGTVISVTGVVTGRWMLVITNNEVNVKKFGAKGDGVTDDRARLQAAIDFCETNGYVLTGTRDDYLINATLKVGSNSNIDFREGTLVRGWQPTNGDGSPMNPVPQANKRRHCVLANKDAAVDFSTKHTNITIKNIKFSNPTLYFGCFLSLYYVENVILDNIYCDRTVQDWNITLLGNKVNVSNVSINQGDSAPVYEDGIHLLGGRGFNINDCFIKCGDDAIAITVLEDSSIEDVNINNIYVDSSSGNAIRISNDFTTPLGTISRINVNNITGKAGKIKNGGIVIYDNSFTSMISKINLNNIELYSGNVTQITQISNGIYIAYAKDVKISNAYFDAFQKGIYLKNVDNVRIVNTSFKALTGLTTNTVAPIYVENGTNVIFDKLTLPNYVYFFVLRLNNSSKVKILNSHLYNIQTNNVGVYLEGTCSNIKVLNNIFEANAATTNIYTVRNYGTTSNITVRDSTLINVPVLATSQGNEYFFSGIGTVTNLISDKMANTVAYTLPIIASGATITQSVTVGLAAIGDLVEASFIGLNATIVNLTAQVTTANSVLCTFRNFSASPTTAVIGTLSVKLIK